MTRHDELVKEGKMREDKTSERRMHLATRLENMGYQLHGPHKGWLITRISSVDSSPTLDHVEALVERLEEAHIGRQSNELYTPRNRDSTRHKELVEEIRLLWCEECAEGQLSWEYGYDEADEPCTSGAEDLCRERARKVIARVVEGPLPGELSRDVTGDDLLMIIIGASQGTGEEKDENRQDDSGS